MFMLYQFWHLFVFQNDSLSCLSRMRQTSSVRFDRAALEFFFYQGKKNSRGDCCSHPFNLHVIHP